MTPASLTDTLTAMLKRHASNPDDGLDIMCVGCGQVWVGFTTPEGCFDYRDAVAALAIVAQIRSEAQAILDAHHGDQVGIKPWCAVCSFPMPCATHQRALAILALTGDTEEAT